MTRFSLLLRTYSVIT